MRPHHLSQQAFMSHMFRERQSQRRSITIKSHSAITSSCLGCPERCLRTDSQYSCTRRLGADGGVMQLWGHAAACCTDALSRRGSDPTLRLWKAVALVKSGHTQSRSEAIHDLELLSTGSEVSLGALHMLIRAHEACAMIDADAVRDARGEYCIIYLPAAADNTCLQQNSTMRSERPPHLGRSCWPRSSGSMGTSTLRSDTPARTTTPPDKTTLLSVGFTCRQADWQRLSSASTK